MKEYDFHQLLHDKEKLLQTISTLQEKEILRQTPDEGEIKGHLQKAHHNLRFVSDTKPEYLDWAITGCYYACYHAALALILTIGYSSKNHLATLCLLIQHFYADKLDLQDLEAFNKLLDYHDLMFYVETKNKREDATYSTKVLFNTKEADQLRMKAALFVNKVEEILKQRT